MEYRGIEKFQTQHRYISTNYFLARWRSFGILYLLRYPSTIGLALPEPALALSVRVLAVCDLNQRLRQLLWVWRLSFENVE